jgi:hypothetical protein
MLIGKKSMPRRLGGFAVNGRERAGFYFIKARNIKCQFSLVHGLLLPLRDIRPRIILATPPAVVNRSTF